ncbi:T214A protein, partial [Crypturellus undulatus]|nr:T214A protein [Crypturellus undulatus]
MKGRGFPWARLLLVVLVFATGFLLHDVRTQGSFQASSSARLLRSSGILSVSQQAWHKVSHCSLEGYRRVARAERVRAPHACHRLQGRFRREPLLGARPAAPGSAPGAA